ncbi:MAK10-like protein, partial [Tanacetum coccineum]
KVPQCVETSSEFLLTTSKYQRDDVTDFGDDVTVADTKKDIEDSTGESLSEAWTRFKDLLQKVPHHEDFALYDNESWNDPRDFGKPVKAISLPHYVPNTSDHRLSKLKNQVQRLMEAHFAPKLSVQVNKIASSCEICHGPHDTHYCMENSDQAFVDYARVLLKRKAINDRMMGALPSNTVKSSKLNVNPTSLVSSSRSPNSMVSEDVILVNIYAPQPESLKQSLWKELIDLKSKMAGIWIFFGDFNSVRCKLERSGSQFVKSDANAFNDFICNAGLMDMQLGDPETIKAVVFSHFENRFKDSSTASPKFCDSNLLKLEVDDRSLLDASILMEEVKRAV